MPSPPTSGRASSPRVMVDPVRPDGTITWRELWAETTTALDDRLHARWMCEAASDADGAAFIAELDQPATERMVAHLDAMIARRLAGEPLQYVLGRWAFRTLDLMIDRRVLIPRPETEWVCEAALNLVRPLTNPGATLRRAAPLRLVDLGTGSGAIGLSLAAELPPGSATVWLTDVSADALDVARANLAGIGRAGACVRIGLGSWFDALPDDLRGAVDLVVANPPYISADDVSVDQAVTDWEPHSALFADDDGLADISVIASGAVDWLRPGGWLVMEIGATQGDAVGAILSAHFGDAVEIREDLTGRDRIAIAQRG